MKFVKCYKKTYIYKPFGIYIIYRKDKKNSMEGIGMDKEQFKTKFSHNKLCELRKNNYKKYEEYKDLHKECIRDAIEEFDYFKILNFISTEKVGVSAPILISDNWTMYIGNIMHNEQLLFPEFCLTLIRGNFENFEWDKIIDFDYWQKVEDNFIHKNENGDIEYTFTTKELLSEYADTTKAYWIRTILDEFEEDSNIYKGE